MALFGNRLKFDRTGFDLTPSSPVPTTVPDQREIAGNPLMAQGLNRPLWDRVRENAPQTLSILGATLNDVGGSLSGNYTDALGRLDAQRQRQALLEKQSSFYDELAAHGAVAKNPYEIIAKGAQAGLPIDSLTDLLTKARQREAYEYQGRVIERGPDGKWITAYEPPSDPLQPLEADKIRAQTDYYRAGVPLREQQTRYQSVKADHPYAPQRPRQGAGIGSHAPGADWKVEP
ncbi:hypothetical protein [Asticcacaulis sp.]|uniref:hypothetical protein n=1 Tax=Asticcacaulis sp. TaxID=1872648 RepID=UPI0031E3ED2A